MARDRPDDIITAMSAVPTLAMYIAELGVELGEAHYAHSEVYFESALKAISKARPELDRIEAIVRMELARYAAPAKRSA